MAQGYSIHIGLNNVDTNSPDYQGFVVPVLAGCINDANSMEKLASGLGYSEVTKLIDGQATAANVIGAISSAANNAEPGDIALLTYSGHGSQVVDQNGDESDGEDETWVLYDRMLVDDELANLWPTFKTGVRIFVLSDSCHSGTVDRNFYDPQFMRVLQRKGITKARRLRRLDGTPHLTGSPQQVAGERLARLHGAVLRLPVVRDTSSGASVILISGCQDNQTSQDGDANGLFTENLLKVWNSGFQGTYRQFTNAICKALEDPTQSPNYDTAGTPNPAFEAQQPFAIAGAATNGGGQPSGPTAQRPSITGPASAERGGMAPQFDVNPGSNGYYAVELASSSDLLADGASGRNDSNYFASWEESGFYAQSPYELPAAHWEQLQNNDRLYYRVWTSSSSDAWADQQTSTPNNELNQAPSLEITGEAPADGGNRQAERELVGARAGGWSQFS